MAEDDVRRLTELANDLADEAKRSMRPATPSLLLFGLAKMMTLAGLLSPTYELRVATPFREGDTVRFEVWLEQPSAPAAYRPREEAAPLPFPLPAAPTFRSPALPGQRRAA